MSGVVVTPVSVDWGSMGLGIVFGQVIESGGPGDCVFATAGEVLDPVEVPWPWSAFDGWSCWQ